MDNVGGQLRLTLKSKGSFRVQEWEGKQKNRFDYEVLKDNQPMTLSATDSLHNRIIKSNISVEDDFLLSWEQYTNKDGQLIRYWKIEKVSKESANPQFENVKKSVNEFEQQLQKDKALKQQVNTTNSTFTNGARFGMIFNNCVRLFIENGQSWTTDEFVNNFKRVEGWVEACENKPNTPVDNNLARLQEQRVDASSPSNPVVVDEDDLPF